MIFDALLLDRLRSANNVVFFTGAGASIESGIPTFRGGKDSFWVDFDVETFATLDGFLNNPKQVWQWYAQRRLQIQGLQPNLGHQVMARWQAKASKVTVITQNIDNLHQRAGSQAVLELHGNIAQYKCVRHHPVTTSVDLTVSEPPLCPQCGTLIRPNVVWFHEALPASTLNLAEIASFESDVFVSIGCSMNVQPAASLPYLASQCGAYVLQINPESTDLDEYAHCNLRGKSGEVMPKLWEAVWGECL